MICPKCGTLEDKVVDSRLSKNGRSIRRRRECIACENRFTTYEEIERVELRILKTDESSEPFDKHKILSGMLKACYRRPVSRERLEDAVEEIVNELEAGSAREVPSSKVGSLVMEHLHTLDEVAYVRYASVYRRFQDVGEFIDEIQQLEHRQKRTTLQPELFK